MWRFIVGIVRCSSGSDWSDWYLAAFLVGDGCSILITGTCFSELLIWTCPRYICIYQNKYTSPNDKHGTLAKISTTGKCKSPPANLQRFSYVRMLNLANEMKDPNKVIAINGFWDVYIQEGCFNIFSDSKNQNKRTTNKNERITPVAQIRKKLLGFRMGWENVPILFRAPVEFPRSSTQEAFVRWYSYWYLGLCQVKERIRMDFGKVFITGNLFGGICGYMEPFLWQMHEFQELNALFLDHKSLDDDVKFRHLLPTKKKHIFANCEISWLSLLVPTQFWIISSNVRGYFAISRVSIGPPISQRNARCNVQEGLPPTPMPMTSLKDPPKGPSKGEWFQWMSRGPPGKYDMCFCWKLGKPWSFFWKEFRLVIFILVIVWDTGLWVLCFFFWCSFAMIWVRSFQFDIP